MVENVTGAPVTGSNLFGREFEVEELWRLLQKKSNILMLAPRRVGKTSLMLELSQNPQENWTVFYSDLEGGASAADFLSEIIASLASHESYKNWIEALPFREELTSVLKRVSGSVAVEGLRVEIKGAIGANWEDNARRLEARLEQLPDENKVLFILDEFPILLAHILADEKRTAEAESLLTWFRRIRLNPKISDKVSFLIGGSIGIDSVLRKHNLSAHINDLSPFRVEGWSRETATDFINLLGENEKFVISPDLINVMLDLLREQIPYHIQLFFQSLRQECRGDVSKLNKEIVERMFNENLAGPSGTSHLDHYATRLDTMFTAEELVVVRRLLNLVCRSQNGLRKEVVGAFAQENPEQFTKILRQLREDKYLVVKDDEGIQFSSNLVRLYWRNNQAEWGAQ